MLDQITVNLSDGRAITLTMPTAGQLRGVKLLDVLQFDTAAHALVVDRCSNLTAAEFQALAIPDAMRLMEATIGFLSPSDPSLSPSKTPTP